MKMRVLFNALVCGLAVQGWAVGVENATIALCEIGARAAADYRGDALDVTATVEGARLRYVFQKLEGRATPQGLWLESTDPGGGRLRLVAQAMGREVLERGSPVLPSVGAGAFQSGRGLPQSKTVQANHIAKWDGSAWSTLGGGVNGSVNALAVRGATLYAGGDFDLAGGVTANNLAGWDGSAWSALGSGTYGPGHGTVYGLATDGSGHLFAGGTFSLAGTAVPPFIAQANIGPTPGRLGSLVYSPGTGFSCTFSDATVGQPYHIQTSPSMAAGSWTDLTNFTYTGPIVISDPSAAAGPKKLYRAVSP